MTMMPEPMVMPSIWYDDWNNLKFDSSTGMYKDQFGALYNLDSDEPWTYYFDHQNVERRGDFCLDQSRDEWFNCAGGYYIQKDAYYRMNDDCWHSEKGSWYNCNMLECDWYGMKESCDRYHKGEKDKDSYREDDPLEDLADAIEDAAEDWADDNEDQIDNLVEAAQDLFVDTADNVTALLNDTVNDAFEQLRNDTDDFLNSTQADLLDAIQEAQDELFEELDLNDNDWEGDWEKENKDWENDETWEKKEEFIALLENAPESGFDSTTFALSAIAGFATAYGALALQKNCNKNDSDFMRV